MFDSIMGEAVLIMLHCPIIQCPHWITSRLITAERHRIYLMRLVVLMRPYNVAISPLSDDCQVTTHL